MILWGEHTKYKLMTSKEALAKLKKYWVNNRGDDYFEKLNELRKEIPSNHKSSTALDNEISILSKVHRQFKMWTVSNTAKGMLNKRVRFQSYK